LVIASIRVALAVYFAASAATKASDVRDFRRALHGYGTLPDRATTALSVGVPLAEAVTVALLLTSEWRAGTILATLLLLLFATVMIAEIGNGRHPDCGCGGLTASHSVSWTAVFRNLVIAAIATASLRFDWAAAWFTIPNSPAAALSDVLIVEMALALLLVIVATEAISKGRTDLHEIRSILLQLDDRRRSRNARVGG
jgi:Methylamine utilisation protein MauE